MTTKRDRLLEIIRPHFNEIKDFADFIGVTPTTVSNWLGGRSVPSFSPETIHKIIQAVGIVGFLEIIKIFLPYPLTIKIDFDYNGVSKE